MGFVVFYSGGFVVSQEGRWAEPYDLKINKRKSHITIVFDGYCDCNMIHN